MKETNNTHEDLSDEKNTACDVYDYGAACSDTPKYGGNSEKIDRLLSMVKKKDLRATNELVDMYSPLIKSEIRRVRTESMTHEDEEDMFQECLLRFFHAVETYETNEAVSFGLYAKICIRNGLVSYLRSFSRMNPPDVFLYEGDIDRLQKGDVSDYSDPITKIIEEENVFALQKRIESCLSQFEIKVWQMYVSGMKNGDIAKKLGVHDVRVVSNAIYRIRKKLRRLLS